MKISSAPFKDQENLPNEPRPPLLFCILRNAFEELGCNRPYSFPIQIDKVLDLWNIIFH